MPPTCTFLFCLYHTRPCFVPLSVSVCILYSSQSCLSAFREDQTSSLSLSLRLCCLHLRKRRKPWRRTNQIVSQCLIPPDIHFSLAVFTRILEGGEGGGGMEEAVEVVAGVNVFMYVWKAMHGGGGLAGWRRTLTPCASCQINHGSTWGSDLTSAWICNTEACTHTHTNTHRHFLITMSVYAYKQALKEEMHPSAKRAFRLTVVLSENLHFKYANKSDIYHRNMDVNLP